MEACLYVLQVTQPNFIPLKAVKSVANKYLGTLESFRFANEPVVFKFHLMMPFSAWSAARKYYESWIVANRVSHILPEPEDSIKRYSFNFWIPNVVNV